MALVDLKLVAIKPSNNGGYVVSGYAYNDSSKKFFNGQLVESGKITSINLAEGVINTSEAIFYLI